MTPPAPRKRSSHVALAILGAAAFTLAGCKEEQVDAQAFPDLNSCREVAQASGKFPVADCDAAHSAAQTLHVEAAPRYDSLATCEAQHGQGACGNESQVQSGGSGSIFMPLMMGYLMGSMMSNARGAAASQPLYRSSGGGFTNAAGTSTFSSNSGAGKMPASQFARPTSTIGKPPMSTTSVQSRGGFGASGGGAAGG